MKISVKTLKGSHFEIEVKPNDRVEDVKKVIESNQGENVYPASQQMIIHQGKVLKEGTTLEENSVSENSFVVVMLSKNKASAAEVSTRPSAPTVKEPETSAPLTSTSVSNTQPPSASAVPLPTSAPILAACEVSDVYDQAASNLVAGNNLEGTILQILDMGRGNWDRDTVVQALRAAFNNPERAVDYLYSGIPESAEAPPTTGSAPSGPAVNVPSEPQTAQPATVPATGPNANPLDLFPQGFPSLGSNAGGADANTLDFLRNIPQFQALRTMVLANPQILQPLLQELGKHNPQLMRLIQEHQSDFVRLINEATAEGEEGINNILGQVAGGMPQGVTVSPEEREAIERLEALGFDRELVLEVFFTFNKNEELAANYLYQLHEFDE